MHRPNFDNFCDYCAEQCLRLIAAGGSSFVRDVPNNGRPVPQEERNVWARLAAEGVSGYRIGKDRGWEPTTVNRYLRRMRGRATDADRLKIAGGYR